jgi:hypothetical protein
MQFRCIQVCNKGKVIACVAPMFVPEAPMHWPSWIELYAPPPEVMPYLVHDLILFAFLRGLS